MDTVECAIAVGDASGTRFEAIDDALIDTGATYTWIPSDVLQRVGVAPEEKRPFIMADGTEREYDIAWARVRIDGRSQPSICIFGDPGAQALVGVFTLEAFGVAVDPVNRRLVPVAGHLASARGR